MLQKRIKVDTAHITLGMFVAQLDRSWLETPFIERGFVVAQSDQIGLLRKFCNYVYIDVERSALPEKDILSAHQQSAAVRDPFSETFIVQRRALRVDRSVRGFFKFLRRLNPVGRGQGTGTVSTRDEAPAAAAAFGTACEHMRAVLTGVKKGRQPDIENLLGAVTPMVDSVMRNADALAWYGALRKREEGNFSYTMTTAIWALILGRHLGFERHRLMDLAMGGLLLDIGNTRIPRSIGAKDGPLTAEEQEIMQMHVAYGVDLVKKTFALGDDVLDMVRCHHERHDGSGYPAGISGEDIPIYGRIAGVIDCYDSIISKRPYADPKCACDAVRELNMLAGKQFQSGVIEQFVQAIGTFPSGSLVELNTGEVAIVVEQNRQHRLRPNLLMVMDENKQPVRMNKILNLSKVPGTGEHRRARWITGGYADDSCDIDPMDYFFGLKGTA